MDPEPLAPVRAVYKASMATRRTMAGGSGRVAASDEKKSHQLESLEKM